MHICRFPNTTPVTESSWGYQQAKVQLAYAYAAGDINETDISIRYQNAIAVLQPILKTEEAQLCVRDLLRACALTKYGNPLPDYVQLLLNALPENEGLELQTIKYYMKII